MQKDEYVMASHNPIACLLGETCIHFVKVREHETIPVLVIESIHCTLSRIEQWHRLDAAWENFHGLYWQARKLLRC
jgi:hypothetical protein